MTEYQMFAERWRDCTACRLCEGRKRVVLARGSVPCDVLFVGEAPGESEDVLGRPFAGPAGHLLDAVLREAVPQHVRYCLTNLVCCIPRDESGGKAHEPDDPEVRACSVRLLEFVGLCRPRLIVCVGRLARDWLDPLWKKAIPVDGAVVRVDIVHPAAILRMTTAQRGLAVKRCVVTLANAVEEYL